MEGMMGIIMEIGKSRAMVTATALPEIRRETEQQREPPEILPTTPIQNTLIVLTTLGVTHPLHIAQGDPEMKDQMLTVLLCLLFHLRQRVHQMIHLRIGEMIPQLPPRQIH